MRVLKSTDDGQFEFCFPTTDTLLLVQRLPHGVLIRATRDTFSECRKVSFIRELAAEGFIDDCYRLFSGFDQSILPIRWCIDYSWLKPGRIAQARTNYFMIKLLMFAGLLWLSLMTALLLRVLDKS